MLYGVPALLLFKCGFNNLHEIGEKKTAAVTNKTGIVLSCCQALLIYHKYSSEVQCTEESASGETEAAIQFLNIVEDI